MTSTSILLLIAFGCSCTLAMYDPRTRCPDVNVTSGASCDSLCSGDQRLVCPRGQWCCPNECGTTSCTHVMLPCTENGRVIPHRSGMAYPRTDDPNRCGFCWCLNGKRECYHHPCHGPGPIP